MMTLEEIGKARQAKHKELLMLPPGPQRSVMIHMAADYFDSLAFEARGESLEEIE